jgi:hypothetical protein
MKHLRLHYILISFLTLINSCSIVAQTWYFVKEKDSIKTYIRKESGRSLRSYKGITDIHAPAEKVFELIENVNNTDWWDKNFSKIKVLHYEKNKSAQYYLVYDLPWPVIDRDLCVDVTVKIDPLTGVSVITANPLTGVIPNRHDMIRIKDYHQTWTIIPVSKELTHVILEGYIDPAGTIPNWISNMLIIDSPIKVISGVKNRLEKNSSRYLDH